jgi:uroporphyrinogen decarboxylase
MNARDRFNRIMRFQRPDRVPLWQAEHLTEGAVRKWICGGDVPLGVRRQDVVRFDPCTIVRLDTAPLPAFVGRTIEEDDRWITSVDQYGFTVRTSKDQAVGPTVYYYLAGSVRGRADWEEMKKRFDPADPRRKPREWSHELIEHYNHSDGPVGLWIDWGPGRGIKNGYMMGLEPFLEALTDDPGLIADIFEFWAGFVIEAAREWVGSVRFDFALFNEDGMAFKNSTMVSPEAYRRIWGPPMRRVTDFLRAGGVEVIGYLTSGNIRPLIPVLLELGVNLHMPLECAAGLDARELRRQFPELLMIGNISRQSLMDGPAAVEAEFRAKVPPLMEAGGYIPAVDDMILPDIPYASYRRYAELIRECRL